MTTKFENRLEALRSNVMDSGGVEEKVEGDYRLSSYICIPNLYPQSTKDTLLIRYWQDIQQNMYYIENLCKMLVIIIIIISTTTIYNLLI